MFMTGVDTKYPVKDSYYKNAHFYEKYSPFVRGVSAGMILVFLIFFTSVVWLVDDCRSNGKRWRTASI